MLTFQSRSKLYAIIGVLALTFVFFAGLASLPTTYFEPHGHCFLWYPALMGVFVVSDMLIGFAYVVISFALIYLIRITAKDVPYDWMVVAFGTFIFACGMTHFMDVWTLYKTDFWLSGGVRVITALASVVTAVLLPPLIPPIVRLIRDAKVSKERKARLETLVIELQREVTEREKAEATIRQLNAELEERVRQRTAQLEEAYREKDELLRREKALHEEIRHHADVLEERVQERTAQLTQANRELEAFSYSVSHDLRAPLRVVDGYSHILLEEYRDQVDDEFKFYLERMRSASQRMGQLIDDLLNLARVSRQTLNITQVNMSRIVKDMADDLRIREPERQVTVVVQPDVEAMGDERLLTIVIENLMLNAWKFTSKKPDGRIEFGMIEDEGKPTYFVRDNGAGFDMAFVDKLFGTFQRLHTETEFEGTGIGLVTVQRIIHRHGGSIRAEGAVGEGATFYFTLGDGFS